MHKQYSQCETETNITWMRYDFCPRTATLYFWRSFCSCQL